VTIAQAMRVKHRRAQEGESNHRAVAKKEPGEHHGHGQHHCRARQVPDESEPREGRCQTRYDEEPAADRAAGATRDRRVSEQGDPDDGESAERVSRPLGVERRPHDHCPQEEGDEEYPEQPQGESLAPGKRVLDFG
jgi:hypothetical protein